MIKREDSVGIKMLVTDMDGTLLCGTHQMSAYTVETLTQAAQQGILFVPATGRLLGGLPPAVRALPFFRYAILMNGAQVYDHDKNLIIRQISIAPEEADDVFAFLQQFPATLDCYAEGDEGYMEADHFHNIDALVPDQLARQLLRASRSPVSNLRAFILEKGKRVMKIQAYFRDAQRRQEAMEAVSKALPNVAVSCSLPGNVEITHRDATKGAALTFLCAHLQIPMAQVMAFGDERNDVSMLRTAGIGVAMGNAASEALAAADIVTATNLEDGVAQLIHSMVLMPATAAE